MPPDPHDIPAPSGNFDRKAARRRAVAIWAGGIAGLGALAALAPSAGIPAAAPLAALPLWLWLADRKWMRRPGGIPCLTWHSVSRDPSWLPWAAETSVTPETLDRQLRCLSEMGCKPMDTVDFVRRRLSGKPVPPETVLLHFDDGYLDNRVAAAPILRRHGMRATLFVSLDFIEPDRPPVPSLDDTDTPPRWDGYLSWAELAELDAGGFGGVFDVQPHGVDHGRVPTGPRVVDRLTEGNWRRLAWMQWAAMPGAKHGWYRATSPPAVPLGTPVPESEAALAAPAWDGQASETEAAYAERVRRHLRACREAFQAHLGKVPTLFCWPQNRCSALARRIAAEEGYLATTAGRGANREGENPAIISRVHVGERMAGFRWPWMDDLVFRAIVRCFQGNHYWYLVLIAARLLKAAHAGPASRREPPVHRRMEMSP